MLFTNVLDPWDSYISHFSWCLSNVDPYFCSWEHLPKLIFLLYFHKFCITLFIIYIHYNYRFATNLCYLVGVRRSKYVLCPYDTNSYRNETPVFFEIHSLVSCVWKLYFMNVGTELFCFWFKSGGITGGSRPVGKSYFRAVELSPLKLVTLYKWFPYFYLLYELPEIV